MALSPKNPLSDNRPKDQRVDNRAVPSEANSSGDGNGDESGDDGGDAGDSGSIAVPTREVQPKDRSRTKLKSELKTPSLYTVILMNDDFTPMDFVIDVIQRFFGKDLEEATKIMLQVHYQGSGVCGVFTFEIAETKVHQVNQYSRQKRHPLKCIMEKA